MKIDMHICTTHSKHPDENPATPQEAIKIAKKRGLDGILIADHDTQKGAEEAKKHTPPDFLVITGNEISAKEGHIVIVGVETKIPKNTPLKEVLKITKDNDGTVILPHPNITSIESSICEPMITKHKEQIDACHLLSTRHLLFYRTFKNTIKTHGFTPIGCSYAHNWNEIATAYTEFDNITTEDDLLWAIKKNKVKKISPLKTPTGIQNIARSNIKVIKKFIYWRRYFLKERTPIYYKDTLKAIEEKKSFTPEQIKTYLNETKSTREVENDAIAEITIQETLRYLEKKGIIEKNKEYHLKKDQKKHPPQEINKPLLYRISLRYFTNLIFR